MVMVYEDPHVFVEERDNFLMRLSMCLMAETPSDHLAVIPQRCDSCKQYNYMGPGERSHDTWTCPSCGGSNRTEHPSRAYSSSTFTEATRVPVTRRRGRAPLELAGRTKDGAVVLTCVGTHKHLGKAWQVRCACGQVFERRAVHIRQVLDREISGRLRCTSRCRAYRDLLDRLERDLDQVTVRGHGMKKR